MNFGQGTTSSSCGLPVDLAVGQEKCIALPVQLNPRYATIAKRAFQIQITGQGQILNTAEVHARSNDLAITDIEVDRGQSEATVTALTERGKRYQLRQSVDLTGKSWADVRSEFDGGDAPVELVVDLPLGDMRRFFRVIEK